MKAPTHTVRHFTFASGKNLNMSANKTAMMPSENTKLTTLKITSKDSDQFCATQELKADNKDEMIREVSNKKDIETMRPKEKMRDRR